MSTKTRRTTSPAYCDAYFNSGYKKFDVGYGKYCGGPHTIARQIESVMNLRSVVSIGQA